MAEGLRRARQRFGALHGVIHAAGVQSVGSIFEKSIDDFQQVLDPKIAGTLVLDQVLRDDNLDFICYFSSSAAILGDFGACDYAVASRFQATHAAQHNTRVSQGERHGRAIVIHWPLWQAGGMGFRGNTPAEHLYLKSSGQRALRAQEGLEIFERILSQDNTQHLVLVGQPERVRRFLAPKHSVPATGSTRPVSYCCPSGVEHTRAGVCRYDPASDVALPLPQGEGTNIPRQQGGKDGQDERDREPGSMPSFMSAGKGRRVDMKGLTVTQCVAWDLAELTSQLLQIPRHRLEPAANLADFGFDSISLS